MEGCSAQLGEAIAKLAIAMIEGVVYLLYQLGGLLYKAVLLIIRKIREKPSRTDKPRLAADGIQRFVHGDSGIMPGYTKETMLGVATGVVCPYCLERDSIRKTDENSQQFFSCSQCNMRVASEYVKNANTPREVISAVGFRGHGKTVYFGSLFHTMNDLAKFWPGFYTFAVDERSLDIVRQNSKLLKVGNLPAATPMNFPTPTIVRFSNIPSLGDRFFLFYDTSGEAYAKQSTLIKHASFVRNSHAVIFILSLDDLEEDGQKMHELLSTYVQGLTELEGNTKNQHLIVVLSKGDRLKERLGNHEDIWRYLEEGNLDKLGSEKLGNYVNGMKRISLGLRDFVRDDLGETQFLNFAGDRFKSVEFSIVSALGAEPAGNRLQVEIVPKRIMDPILWVVYRSKGLFRKDYL
jgi:Zn ribbon nucleic-acid-binding protein